MGFERLSAQDSVFLHIETPGQPQHVGGLVLLESKPFFDEQGRFRLDEVRQAIGDRLHLVPRFRKRIMPVPFEQGRPVWVDDERFDLSYHVRLTALPTPGTEQQLKALMGRLMAHALDRSRPLWEIWFVEGIEGDRVAVISKTHHAMVDGISSVDVATVLFDLTAEPTGVEPAPWEAEPAPNSLELLIESLVERATEPAEMVRSARAALRAPRHAIERAVSLAQSIVPLAPAAGRAPRMPWNASITPHRRWEEARVPLARVKAIKDAATSASVTDGRCTVNDVVLAACSGALGSFLLERGEDVSSALTVKAMVPVSVRDDTERYTLGNRVSMLAADLPVGEIDPRQRLRRVHAMMSALKESGQAIGADRLVQMSNYVPPTILGLASRLLVRARVMNLVITNVPGPQFPLYCMGARVLEVFPYVGLAENLGLNIAVVSYEGQLGFGITGDRELLPDLDVLAGLVAKSFVELEEAVGGRQPRADPSGSVAG
ncbi:MAG: WS/DGAT/MGAT family O-acyltransferase [Acidimicrobiales bacterium]